MRAGTIRYTGLRKIGETVEFENSFVIITYPSPTTWEADIIFDPNVTQYNYRLIKASGEPYQWQTYDVSVPSTEPTVTSAVNTLDKWGARLDTARLGNEDNLSYKTRLLDVFQHKGGPTHVGLLNSFARDLDLEYNDQALIINSANSATTGLRLDRVRLGMTSRYVYVRFPELIVNKQKTFVDPATGSFTPTYHVDSNLEVTDSAGNLLNTSYDQIENIVFIEDDYSSPFVYVSYTYYHLVEKTGKTLEELADELEALENPYGDQIITVTVATGLEDYDASKLQRLPETLIPETSIDASGEEVSGLAIKWVDCKIEVVWDQEIQDQERSWTGSLWNTRFDSAYVSLVKTAKQTWGTAVADDSVWGSNDFPLHGGQCLDSTYDSPLGYWVNDVTGQRFDKWEALNGTDPKTGATLRYSGIYEFYYQSGVGSGTDLKVSLKSESYERDFTEGRHNSSDASEGDIPEDDGVLGVIDLE